MRTSAFDLVLTGLQSDDQGFAQTGVILAERLGLPHATIVMEVQVGRGRRALRVKRELEGGWFQWVAMPLPAVLTIQSGINQLRYATLKASWRPRRRRSARSRPPTALPRQQQIVSLDVPEKTQEDADDCRLAAEARRPGDKRRW